MTGLAERMCYRQGDSLEFRLRLLREVAVNQDAVDVMSELIDRGWAHYEADTDKIWFDRNQVSGRLPGVFDGLAIAEFLSMTPRQ
jgi:hypothetical protein